MRKASEKQTNEKRLLEKQQQRHHTPIYAWFNIFKSLTGTKINIHSRTRTHTHTYTNTQHTEVHPFEYS